MNEYQEKLKTLNTSRFKGKSKKKPVINQNNGTLGGHETEHWDGRQDVNILLSPVKIKTTVQGE